jgi:transposase
LEDAALAMAQKKAQRERRTIVFIDETGISERPTRVRTWAPIGQTPVLQYSFRWTNLSIVAGITFWRFYFRLFAGAIRGPQFVEFLKALGAQIRGKLLIIWDGLPGHKSRIVRNYVESRGDKFVLETLPPYAPELNPVEYIWAYMKQRELANLCLDTIGQIGAYARSRLKSMQRRPRIITACWQQAELPI